MIFFLLFIIFISCKLEVACPVRYDDKKSDFQSYSRAQRRFGEELIGFDIESNSALELTIKYFDDSVRKYMSKDGSDFSIIIHLFAYYSIGLFDSIAPYDRYAIGIIRYFNHLGCIISRYFHFIMSYYGTVRNMNLFNCL